MARQVAPFCGHRQGLRRALAEHHGRWQFPVVVPIQSSAGTRGGRPIAWAEVAGHRHTLVSESADGPVVHLDWLQCCEYIGLHGFNHDNKLIFLGERRMRERLERCRPFIERFEVRSFRSPSWLRSEAL